MGSFNAPKIERPKIEDDPNLAAEQAQAQRSLISGLQNQAQMDTANIMARYGTLTALANAGFTPTSTLPPDTVPMTKADYVAGYAPNKAGI